VINTESNTLVRKWLELVNKSTAVKSQNWAAVVTGQGTMSVSGSNVHNFRYRKIEDLVWVSYDVEVTTAGTPGPYFNISLPVDAVASQQTIIVPTIAGGAWEAAGMAVPTGGDIQHYRSAIVSWPNGNHRVRGNYFYECVSS
jgi:hypothetical protein